MERGSIEMKMQMLLASLQRSSVDSFNLKQLEQVGSFVYLIFHSLYTIYIFFAVYPFGHQELCASGEHRKEFKHQGMAGFGFHYHRTFGLHICQGSNA